jgi:hypothetical protein
MKQNRVETLAALLAKHEVQVAHIRRRFAKLQSDVAKVKTAKVRRKKD